MPVVFSFAPGEVQGSFFLLGAGDDNNSGTLKASDWLVPLGDLDGDGRLEYRIDARGEGAGGWGDPRTNGCPATLAPAYPPLVLILKQDQEDLDGDGVFDIFEDRNHNRFLDPGEDRDLDGRLTPATVQTPFGSFPGCEGTTREDQDCDGFPDLVNEDFNRNGRLDPGEDWDGDLRLDPINEDRNGNGLLDSGEDTNLNGFLDIGPYIEDRNNNENLDDRVRPLEDDVLFEILSDGTIVRLPAQYPYQTFRPAPGGILVASVAWNGGSYDLDAINTPTRFVTLSDGRQFRMIDAMPLDHLLPRFTGARIEDAQGYRVHIDPSRLQTVDDAWGARVVFNTYGLALASTGSDPLETIFLESGTRFLATGRQGRFFTLFRPHWIIPSVLDLTVHSMSSGSNEFLSDPAVVPRPRARNLLDQDGDRFPIPEDNCPNTPNIDPLPQAPSGFFYQVDSNADGLGDACDPSGDPTVPLVHSWSDRLVDPGVDPGPAGAAAYDEDRRRFVFFGGSSDPATWEFDGASWQRVEADVAPQPRNRHQMVYDSVNRRVLLFGGFDPGGSPLNDLWQYVDRRWSQIETPVRPIVKSDFNSVYGAAMAFDSARDLLVLFGGDDKGRTWVFDGAEWRAIPSARSPLPRFGHTMVFDPFRQVTVLHGGIGLGNQGVPQRLFNDTWEFDGHTWQPIDTLGDVPPNWGGLMTFDPARREVVNFGGEFLLYQSVRGFISRLLSSWRATRVYNGREWRLLPTRPTTLTRGGPGGFDIARGVLVSIGHVGLPDGSSQPLDAELHFPADSDGDGVLDPDDNCPLWANPEQGDADGDRSGDACDTCPGIVDSTQRDLDRDGQGDVCDDDIDGDGVPNHDDRCPAAYVAGRPAESILDGGGPDTDGDGTPDDCDACPHDSNNDADHDGVCGEADNCSGTFNPSQGDSNGDGSGDACQPVLTLTGIRQDGGDLLEVDAVAHDPDGDRLGGTIEFFPFADFVLPAIDPNGSLCESETFPPGRSGEGLVYVALPGFTRSLVDLDSAVECRDGMVDYLVAQGRCDHPFTTFWTFVELLGTPQAICIAPYIPGLEGPPDPTTRIDATVVEFDDTSVRLAVLDRSPALTITFSDGLPLRSDVSSLLDGTTYRMVITVSDGTTLPVTADAEFLHQAEREMVIPRPNMPPRAAITAESAIECTGPSGAEARLDGSASSDPDSTGGTNDDIVSFEWFLGQAGGVPLGTGAILDVTLPLGSHTIALRVTDSEGAIATAEAIVEVRDTTPPAIALTVEPAALWPPNHRMVPVHASLQVIDVCDRAAVAVLVSVTGNEPDDAEGDGDGRTVGDISGAEAGTGDVEFHLRAERSAESAGRIYEVTYRALDASGNGVSALAVVAVPHDLGQGVEPLVLQLESGAELGAARLYWNGVHDALGYDVIAGDVGSLRMEPGRVSLGAVRVLSRLGAGPSLSEGSADSLPSTGRARFYLVQYRDGSGASGFGTESVPLPREPASCEGGCPGSEATASAGGEWPHRR